MCCRKECHGAMAKSRDYLHAAACKNVGMCQRNVEILVLNINPTLEP